MPVPRANRAQQSRLGAGMNKLPQGHGSIGTFHPFVPQHSSFLARPRALHMSGTAHIEEWQALPQRVPRERRSAKRCRADEPIAAGNAVATEGAAAAGTVAEADPPAAVAAGGEAGSGPDSEQQQEQQQEGEGQQQQEGQAAGGGGVAERLAAGRVDLPAYRSSAAEGEKFECECRWLEHCFCSSDCCPEKTIMHWGDAAAWPALTRPATCAALPALPCLPLPADLDHTADVQLHACECRILFCQHLIFKMTWHGIIVVPAPLLAILAAAGSLAVVDGRNACRPASLLPCSLLPACLPVQSAGGATLEEAFENVGVCMFNYMTPLEGISVDPALTRWAGWLGGLQLTVPTCHPASNLARTVLHCPTTCTQLHCPTTCTQIYCPCTAPYLYRPPPVQAVRGGGPRPTVPALQLPG
jgi:hypothetical protein